MTSQFDSNWIDYPSKEIDESWAHIFYCYNILQSLILLGRCVNSLSTGVFLAHASILESSLASGDDVAATTDQISWISSVVGIGGIAGICIDTLLWEYCGRKAVHIYATVIGFVSWMTFYFASSITALVCGKLGEGLTIGCFFSMPLMIVGEYVSPTRRGYFIVISKLSTVISVLSTHMLSLICTRQQIALIGAVTSASACIVTLCWPESPYYLALKGRFEKCKKSYIWLHGDLSHSDKDLQKLIMMQSQKEIKLKTIKEKLSMNNLKVHFNRDFIRVLLIVIMLIIVLDSTGRMIFTVYCYRIMRELFSSKSVAVYCTVAITSLQVVSLAITGFIIRIYDRRSILFTTGIISTVCMYLIGIIYMLKPFFPSDTSFSAATITFLLLQSFFIHVGVVPVTLTIVSEIFPLRSKSLGSFFSGLVFTLLVFLYIKLAPTIMEATSVGGLYSVYATISVVGYTYLYKTLPETKDKSLLAIESEITNNDKALTELRPMLNVEKPMV